LVIVAQGDLDLEQLVMKITFLNGELDDRLFMK